MYSSYQCLPLTSQDRDDLHSIIISKRPPNLLFETDIQSLVKKWTKGKITNFEYLMKLNALSGRLLSDITQYPIFPYIFSSYDSKHINLNDPSIYRCITKTSSILYYSVTINIGPENFLNVRTTQSIKITPNKLHYNGLQIT